MTGPAKNNAIARIKRARGLFKRKPGDPPFAVEWAAYKKREKELEDRLDRRRSPRR